MSNYYIEKLTKLLTANQPTQKTTTPITTENGKAAKSKKLDIFSSNEKFNEFLKRKGDKVSIFTQSTEKISEMDLSEENIEKLTNEKENKDNEFYKTLKEMYSDPLLKDLIDENDDDKISNEEAQKFFEEIKKNDGNDKDLSLDDFSKFMEAVTKNQATTNPETTPLAQENTSFPQGNTPISPSFNGVGGGNGVNGGGYWGGGGGYNGGGVNNSPYRNNFDYKKTEAQTLAEKKAKVETKIKEYNTELDKINNGENEAVKKAIKDKETAEAKLKEQLEKDKNISEGLKTQYNDFSQKLSDKEKEISNCNTEITKTEAEISKGNKNLESLQNALSSLPAPSGKPEDAMIDAKITQRKNKLIQQIETQKRELKELDKKLNNKDTGLKAKKAELEQEKAKLEEQRNQIKREMEKGASEETKAAIKAFEEAEKRVPTVKQEAISKVQTNINKAQTELKQINDEINTAENKKATTTWNFNFTEKLTHEQAIDLERFKAHYQKNKAKYEAVSKQTGVPAELIAALHWRESNGNFNTYLHNGQKLGRVTTIEPKNILFNDWNSAAVHALTFRNFGNAKEGDLNSCLNFAERYNGLGYRKRGVASPYVWAGTSNYSGGKFVRDGVYNPYHKDQQLGVAVMMKAIC